MNDDKLIGGDTTVQVRAAVINKTIISVRAFPHADDGVIFILNDGTEFGVAFSGDEGGFYLDVSPQARYQRTP